MSILKSANFFEVGFHIFSFQVYQPIDVEVLNATHDYLQVPEHDFSITIRVASDKLPDICKKQLFSIIACWLNKTECQKQIGHLCTGKHGGFFVFISKLKSQCTLLEITAESVIKYFVRLCVNIGPICLKISFLFHNLFQRFSSVFSSSCIFNEWVDSSFDLLRFTVDLRLEIAGKLIFFLGL